jgi:raffinose/stachyose/melibiose transport system substrate-binding protein
MIIKSKKFFIVILILAVPMLISCGTVPKPVVTPVKNSDGKVTLNCVLPSDDVKKNDALKNFETDIKSVFPDYDIHLSFIKGDTNAYNTKLKVMMYSDTPPDIFYSGDESFTEELYSSKSIEPLEKKLTDIDYWKMVIPSTKLIGNTGHIYAIPMDEAYYSIMLINTELFLQNNVKTPENFEELKTAVTYFKEKNIIPIAIGGKDGLPVYKMLESFAGTIDNKISSKIVSGKNTFSGEIFNQAATSVKQLIELGAFQSKVETISDEEAERLFYTSKAAIYSTSSDKLAMASTKLNGKIAVLYYPSLSKADGSIESNIVSGGTKKDCGLLVSSLTKYTKEATKLAVEISKYYNNYLYENKDDASIIYNEDSMEWKSNIILKLGISELMTNVKKEGSVNTGFFENSISPEKEKSIKEASTAFITGFLPVNDFLKEMDMSMKLK